MSMDRPNEHEQAIEDYAAAVREEELAAARQAAATQVHEMARDRRQELWRVVSGYRNSGALKPGIYRLKDSRDKVHAEGVLIDAHGDYPPVLPMFR